MDAALIATLAKEGLSLGVKLVMQAVQAGGMTQAEADQLLADARASYGAASADWKDARKDA